MDYFFTKYNVNNAQLQIRDDLTVLGSDHKLMSFSFMWDDLDTYINQSTTTQQQQQRKIWKLDRLLEEDVHIEYIRTFQ